MDCVSVHSMQSNGQDYRRTVFKVGASLLRNILFRVSNVGFGNSEIDLDIFGLLHFVCC